MINVSIMIEEEAARQWERGTEPVDERLINAAKILETALNGVDEVEDLIIEAAEVTDGMPVSDEILSFREDLSEIWSHLRSMKERLRKGAA